MILLLFLCSIRGRRLNARLSVATEFHPNRAARRCAQGCSGSEFRWWEASGIDPLKIAHKLWKKTRLDGLAGRAQPLPRAAATEMATGEPQPVGADRSRSGAP